MTVDQYSRWKKLAIRRPEDVPPATPLSWKVERRDQHAGGKTADDALAVLALQESIRRTALSGRGVWLRDLMERGGCWDEAAAALGVEVDEARELLRVWARGQHDLYRSDIQDGRPRPLGLDSEQHAAVRGLCALLDSERVKTDEAALAGQQETGAQR
ncbi:hypothetical protein [Streptomyces sp. NBC_01439]|uniref:hypothetical protein n=1 Tax=Streptomyces sp. NBC_01439 TaxID=2903867 RepID=UPI002E2C0CD1|nr:hypothetical protein [Streptomyces sp. NBC_01439]